MEHQFHFGKKFYLDKKTGYWISTTCPKVRAHVWVWSNYNEKPKKGFHVHHKDGNKSNNCIENLELMSQFDHLSLHSNTEEFKAFASNQANKVRHLTKAWHASEEGRLWHIENGKKCWDQRNPFEGRCKQCEKEFITKTFHQEFCSNACKSMNRRESGVDNIIILCQNCRNEITINKYSKTKTCSRRCFNVLKSKIN